MKNIILIITFLALSPLVRADPQIEAEFIARINISHDNEIALADLALQKTKNKQVRKIVNKIRKELIKEKTQLLKLKSKWYNNIQYKNIVKSEQEINEINEFKGRSGNEFDKKILEALSRTHADAIEMTGQLLPGLERREIHHMAIKMLKKQGNEISNMDAIRKSL